MKYLKMYENFKEEDIHDICKEYGITNYTINNGLVDVDGDVYLYNKKLKKLPLKFGKVTGTFVCSDNKLTTLEGCPMEVSDFICSFNKLTSLEGCPSKVNDCFSCASNKLTSLKGCPKEIGGFFNCSDNKLKSLEGSPRYVANMSVFDCSNNSLTSLEGCPSKVSDYFDCSNNKLKTLKGGPKEVGNNFVCYSNQLTNLEGYPSEIGGDFLCGDNPVYEIKRLFKDNQSFIDSLDYNYFREGNKINKIRLTQALTEFGLECPENIKGYVWE